MATTEEVKQYLAHWFQLGKKVIVGKLKKNLLVQPVLKGDRYSVQFEECWEKIISPESGDCYLEGTEQTIGELLSPCWEILYCGRCSMPVPVRSLGMPALLCPCNNLPNWPNTELPPPRTPINSQEHLLIICDRLNANVPDYTSDDKLPQL